MFLVASLAASAVTVVIDKSRPRRRSIAARACAYVAAMPMQHDNGSPLWGSPEPKWSGKVRVVALVVASLGAWAVVAGVVYLLTRWFAS